MNVLRFATSFAAAQLYIARAKQKDWMQELAMKNVEDHLQVLFDELPEDIQEKVMYVAAKLNFPKGQPPVRKVNNGD